jgi:poly(beta-D-mannuronate) lyase
MRSYLQRADEIGREGRNLEARKPGNTGVGALWFPDFLASRFIFSVLLLIPCAATSFASDYRVSSFDELTNALEKAKPGDVVVMKDGTWTDQAIVFSGEGSADQPITLRAETPGRVVLTGRSSIRIDGRHLVVSGLWFKDARGIDDTVRIDGHVCRLTECAVTNATGKFFVHLFGTEHRVDHCYLAEKTTDSPTFQVEVEDTPNHHRIDHNHFGHRPPLKRNGGETIRVGYSHQSMKSSWTLVESNLFERCDGELEIISNKSCDNIYRSNTFLKCAGMFTLRHGNRCLVEGNYFLGYHTRGSGGIRVIGDDHTVVNNYIDGVEQGAFWITSGIVDSPLDGYFQARNCVIAFNTVVDCQGPGILLDAGIGTSRRTLRPERIRIMNNLFAMRDDATVVTGKEGERFIWAGNAATREQPGLASEKFRVLDPMLKRSPEGIWKPAENSPVRGTSDKAFRVASDIEGQAREGAQTIGCDEYSTQPVKVPPLGRGDVGPAWLKPSDR